MALDLDSFPPAVKLALIASGEGFSSDDTYAQANQTLQALDKYGDTLTVFGFPPSDKLRLGDGRDALSAYGFGRNLAKSKKKTLGAELDDAQKAARTLRLRGRSVLGSTRSRLLEQSEAEAANAIQAVLESTSDSDKHGEDLAKQLDALAAPLDPLKTPLVAAAASDRGGPETLAKLVTAAATLRTAKNSKPTQRGTPDETQRIDQIDGLIIDICRRARDAAEAASKELGDPALLKAFKLDKLYPRSSSKKEADAPEGPGAGAAEAAATQSSGVQSGEK